MKNDTLKTIAFGTLTVLAFAPFAHAQVSASVTGVQIATPPSDGYSVTVKGENGAAGGEREREEGDDGKTEDGARGAKVEVKAALEREERGTAEQEKEQSRTTSREREDDEALKHIQLRLEEQDLLSADEDGSDEGTTTETEGTSSERMMVREVRDVHSEADLKQFVRTKVKEDESIKQVEVNNGKVEVQYEEPAELFGFINMTLAAHVAVDQAGNVQVTYPWYHIFMKKHATRESIQSDIARALAAQNKMEKEGMASTTVSASTTQATITAGLGIPNIFEIITNSLRSARIAGEATMQ